jgi:hypothetical protein
MKKLTLYMLALMAGLWFIEAVGARAQTTTAQVSGQVTDSTGAAVPQARITITNVDTNESRNIETSGAGSYVVPLLPPGNYKLTVEKQGFQTSEFPGLILEVNQTLAVDVVLKVGSVSQSVTVEAQASQLQATSSALGSVITGAAVADLPLNGRNFSQLLILSAGVTPVSTGQYASVGGGFGSMAGIPGSSFAQPSVGGQWNRGNFWLMDGLNFSVWFTGTDSVLPVLDGIQEFKVQSHNDSAEYGGALGGIINVATKSGTNGLHGSAWEFVRNNVFDARDPFADVNRSSPAPFRENEFGFSVGGPIIIPKVWNGKNKTWFFFTYEGWRYRKPAQSFERFPTAEEINGDFSADYSMQVLYDPNTTAPDPANPGAFIRSPYICDGGGNPVAQGTAGASPCNKLLPSEINPATQGFIKALYSAPNLTGNPAFNYVNNGELSNDDGTYEGRVDQRLGQKDTAWFRFIRMYNPIATPIDTLVNSGSNNVPTNMGGGETHLFSPNLVFDARLGFNRFPGVGGVSPNAGSSIFSSLGYQGLSKYGYVDNIPQAPYTDLGLSGPYENRETSWDFAATVTYVHGKHTIKTGFQLYWLRYQCCALTSGQGQRNQYDYNNKQTGNPSNLGTTGDSLASELLGLPSSIYFAAQDFDFNFPSWAPYFEDKWQVTPKLTVTLGLRYDHTSTPNLVQSQTSELDPATGNWDVGGGKLPPACNTTNAAPCIPGDGNLSEIPFGNKIVLAKNPNVGPEPVDDMFGPRLGFAWRPLEKTVIRGGYGIAYASMMGQIQTFQANVGAWPAATNTQLSFNNVGAPLTTVQDLQSLSASALPTATPWNTQNWMYDPHIKPARSNQWNVDIQRQMAHNILLTAGYVGSKSDRLNVTGLFNVATEATNGSAAAITALTPFPWATDTFMGESIGSAHYNSLQLSAEKRYSDGLQFLLAYTWSKATDDGGSGYFGVENGPGGGAATQNFYNIKSDWGVSAYDIKEYLSASIMYELPVGKGKRLLNHGAAAAILGGWQVNTITSLRSGQPYNLDVLGDVANIGDTLGWSYARPNVIGSPAISSPTAQEYFNPGAFSIPVNSFGNFGKDVLRSAGVYNVDFSLFKIFPIKESVKLEFRAEAFNIFNIQNLSTPGVDIGTADAGVVSAVAVPPREIQLGMKFRF